MKKTEKSRDYIGKKVSIIGLISNLFLAVGKIVVGAISGLISVTADGLNNLSDCGSSAVSFVSFKMSSKPADKEHPYGHERIEYISSMVVSFLILIIAYELVAESIAKIISPVAINISIVVLITLVASIAIKCLMYFYYKHNAKIINSELLKASAIDSLSDCISTSIVLVSTIVSKFTKFNIDGYAGLVVAVFIAIAGIKILKEVISKLIGQAPDNEIFENIKSRILNHPEVLGIHDLNVYSFGPNKYFASVHIELDAKTESLTAHEMIDDIEREFINETNIVLTGHHDPIVTDDEEVNSMRKKVSKLVLKIDKSFSMHDFRMVKGPNKTNVIFEIAVPFETTIKEDDIIETLKQNIEKIDKKYIPVIIVEKQMYI
ncbi:MAG: cation transporter [Clostridia bacterium]|nr:cation transporter [Clostridia bacterium]